MIPQPGARRHRAWRRSLSAGGRGRGLFRGDVEHEGDREHVTRKSSVVWKFSSRLARLLKLFLPKGDGEVGHEPCAHERVIGRGVRLYLFLMG